MIPLFLLTIFPQHVVVLTSPYSASFLFTKKYRKYSDLFLTFFWIPETAFCLVFAVLFSASIFFTLLQSQFLGAYSTSKGKFVIECRILLAQQKLKDISYKTYFCGFISVIVGDPHCYFSFHNSVTFILDCIIISTELLLQDIKSSHHILYKKTTKTQNPLLWNTIGFVNSFLPVAMGRRCTMNSCKTSQFYIRISAEINQSLENHSLGNQTLRVSKEAWKWG